MTIPPPSRSLAVDMRRPILIDLLLAIGLCLFGAGVYLWLGLPATLAYSGIVLVAMAVALAQSETEEGP